MSIFNNEFALLVTRFAGRNQNGFPDKLSEKLKKKKAL